MEEHPLVFWSKTYVYCKVFIVCMSVNSSAVNLLIMLSISIILRLFILRFNLRM